MSKASIVHLIQKMAQKELLEDAPGVTPAAHPAAPGGKPFIGPPTAQQVARQAPVGDLGIMAMQHALQDLAKTVTAEINLQDVASGDPNREAEAKRRDAFGVFLTKNYMRDTKVPGVEYDPNPKMTTLEQKGPQSPTRMSVVMDTMNRVGTPKKGEQFVDGRWGFRTNAAVRDSYVFASGLLDFIDDVNRFETARKIQSPYTRANLANLAQYAKEDPNALTPEEKKKAAPIVTQHIKAIQNMYIQVKNQILRHPIYRQFTEGPVPFKSYKPQVSAEQIQLLKSKFPNGIDLNFPNLRTNIKIDDLVSKEALENWMKMAAPDMFQKGEINPNMVVNQIWRQFASVIGADPRNDLGF